MGTRDRIEIEDDLDRMAERAANLFLNAAKEKVDRQGRFAVALSGGSTPRPMFRLLSQDPYAAEIPWHSTHIFWVDERMVPFDHPDSNFGAAKEDFLDTISIAPDHLHPMPTWTKPEEGAEIYEAELKAYFDRFGDGFPIFDLILLGVGNDGHTASLFPGQRSLGETQRRVLNVKGGEPDLPRLTLTLPVLNRGKEVVFLVSGKKKASLLQAILQHKDPRLPARMVQPSSGELTWILDREAASLLNEEVIHG